MIKYKRELGNRGNNRVQFKGPKELMYHKWSLTICDG